MTWSAVDWTPYLKGLQHECDIDTSEIFEKTLGGGKKTNMPKALRPSVLKYKHIDNQIDIYLKNATAFGQPITRVTARYLSDDAFLAVYFANANFTQLKPQLTVNIDGTSHAIGKQQAWGIIHTKTDQTNKDGEPIINTSYTPILWQQKSQIKDRFGDTDDDFHALLETRETGW